MFNNQFLHQKGQGRPLGDQYLEKSVYFCVRVCTPYMYKNIRMNIVCTLMHCTVSQNAPVHSADFLLWVGQHSLTFDEYLYVHKSEDEKYG